jgi:RimJ/RimL family protein N-acetyltransferase
MPMLAARGGFMPLPDGVIGIEDSIASPSARGRGIGPRTWRALAHEWAGRGAAATISKVAVENASSRRAATKAGYREVGLMSYCRRGPVVHVDVTPLGERGLGEELRQRLRR